MWKLLLNVAMNNLISDQYQPYLLIAALCVALWLNEVFSQLPPYQSHYFELLGMVAKSLCWSPVEGDGHQGGLAEDMIIIHLFN